jgi:hypothetical protein
MGGHDRADARVIARSPSPGDPAGRRALRSRPSQAKLKRKSVILHVCCNRATVACVIRL